MSGADESNDDLVSGRVNRSNDETTIWAENKYSKVGIGPVKVGEFRTDFSGTVIFLVEAAKDTDPDHEGEFRPPNPLDAIVGVGWSADFNGKSGGTGVTGIGGAVAGLGVRGEGGGDGDGGTGVLGDAGGAASGVVGLGGPAEGTGIFGLGSGGDRRSVKGRGGTGVQGVGGRARLIAGLSDILPGAGVFGQGGKVLEPNKHRVLLGTGVIGVGGDAGNKDMPAPKEAGSVGVFGLGADANINQIGGGPTAVFDGPDEPGAGIVGRGGIAIGTRMPVAAGVIGVAGGLKKPDIAVTGDKGVFGIGPTGVHGIGIEDMGTPAGPGVSGSSANNRGGIFSSEKAAQLQLLPHPIATKLPDRTPVTPIGISTTALESGIVSLPKRGQAGDLMTLIDDNQKCTLWFCVKGEDASGPAQWGQVLLGPLFNGQS